VNKEEALSVSGKGEVGNAKADENRREQPKFG
jgi:hypothetical protein